VTVFAGSTHSIKVDIPFHPRDRYALLGWECRP
jgi:hypothetical protein